MSVFHRVTSEKNLQHRHAFSPVINVHHRKLCRNESLISYTIRTFVPVVLQSGVLRQSLWTRFLLWCYRNMLCYIKYVSLALYDRLLHFFFVEINL